ncbi:transposase [Roseobacter insulae]
MCLLRFLNTAEDHFRGEDCRRFNDEQIAFALRQAEAATTVGEVFRNMGIAVATFYRRRKIYAGMGISEIRWSRQLKDVSSKLQRMIADLTLDKVMLQDIPRKCGEACPPPRSCPAQSGCFRSV